MGRHSTAFNFRPVSHIRGREFLSHTFMEIDHEIISTAILFPFADSRRVLSDTSEIM